MYKYFQELQKIVEGLNPILKDNSLGQAVLRNKHIEVNEKEVTVKLPVILTLTFTKAELEKRVAERKVDAVSPTPESQ